MNHTVAITWGQRVHMCNAMPMIGSITEMRTSRIVRYALMDSATEQELAVNGISKNELGEWTIPAKNEGRPSEITLDDQAVNLFSLHILSMSRNKQIPYEWEQVFSAILALSNEAQEVTQM